MAKLPNSYYCWCWCPSSLMIMIVWWLMIIVSVLVNIVHSELDSTKQLPSETTIKNQHDGDGGGGIIAGSRKPKSIDSQQMDSLQKTLSSSTSSQQQQMDLIYKNFQINKNSIIKTHDSRALGAKYLNETELSSNDDCLLWCWNTSNCNLAVFEEKTRGSCYLFDCGSIQDFKCRFASHTFYTSSILQINRNSYLLSEWKSQASQENDLVGLKEKQPPQQQSGYLSIKTSSTSTANGNNDGTGSNHQTPSSNNIIKLETTTSLTKISKCRHYQFECRNNSECIAIYNVCDGIQQCSDGSDEADELECHKSRLNVNGAANTVTVANAKNYLSSTTNGDKTTEVGRASDINSIEKKLLMKAQQQQPPPSNNRISSGNYLSANFGYNYNNKDNNNGAGAGGGQIMNSNQQQLKSIKFSTNNLNLNYPKSPNDKIDDSATSYRNHIQMNGAAVGDYNPGYYSNWNSIVDANNKPSSLAAILSGGNGETDLQSPPQPPYSTPMKESLYWPSFKYQQTNVVDNYLPQNHDIQFNVPAGVDSIRSKTAMDSYSPQQQSFLSQYKLAPQSSSNDQSGSSSLLVDVMKPNSELFRSRTNLSNNNVQSSLSNNGQKGKHQTMLNGSMVNYSHMSLSNAENKVSMKGPNVVAISYMHDTVTQNGRETNSAVIALTLGLFITCILIVIVGCRMKSFKKRIARRGRSLAHDADYLINGMYL